MIRHVYNLKTCHLHIIANIEMAINEDVKTEMGRRLKLCQCGGAGLAAEADDLIQSMLEKNLAFKQNLSPFDVGVHPLNRDGVGLPGRERLSMYTYVIHDSCFWSKYFGLYSVYLDNMLYLFDLVKCVVNTWAILSEIRCEARHGACYLSCVKYQRPWILSC